MTAARGRLSNITRPAAGRLRPRWRCGISASRPEVVAQRQQLLEQLPRLVHAADHRQVVGHPERAGEERALVAGQAVDALLLALGRVAQDEPVGGGQLALDRLDGADHPFVVRRQAARNPGKIDRDHGQPPLGHAARCFPKQHSFDDQAHLRHRGCRLLSRQGPDRLQPRHAAQGPRPARRDSRTAWPRRPRRASRWRGWRPCPPRRGRAARPRCRRRAGRGRDDQDAARVPAPVLVEQVGRPVQGDGGLAGAGTALHVGHGGGGGADDQVLLGLDGGHDVPHGVGAGPAERGHQGAVADHGQAAGRPGTPSSSGRIRSSSTPRTRRPLERITRRRTTRPGSTGVER
ncbi:hypothetical protein BSAF29S_02732 [Bacillus safensis subsp. safensis]